jgi:Zn-finger in ubiquitin-hydrolases and other protein
MKSERDGINPAAKPSGTGCVECSHGGWWLHLRRCAECGHIGCCDSSPSQHASKHHAATGHPIITSFEPGEHWFYDYRTEQFFGGPKLHAPQSHPLDQPVPGPLLSLLARESELRCNIHEVGERAGIHLPHHLASVRLHGNLADAELKADLFIQQTADHQRHDLPLAAA